MKMVGSPSLNFDGFVARGTGSCIDRKAPKLA